MPSHSMRRMRWLSYTQLKIAINLAMNIMTFVAIITQWCL